MNIKFQKFLKKNNDFKGHTLKNNKTVWCCKAERQNTSRTNQVKVKILFPASRL